MLLLLVCSLWQAVPGLSVHSPYVGSGKVRASSVNVFVVAGSALSVLAFCV